MGFVVLALSSAVLFGVWKFGLAAFRGQLSVWAVLLLSGFAALMTYAIRGSATGRLAFDRETIYVGILGGVLNLAGNYLLLQAFKRGKVAVVGGVSSAEGLVPLLFAIISGVTITVSTGLGVALIVAGLLAFYIPHAVGKSGGSAVDAAGDRASVLLALAAALCWGLGILVVDLGARESVTGTLLVQQGMQFAVVLLVVLLDPRRHLAGLTWRSGLGVAGAGLALGLGNVSFYAAAESGSLALATVLAAMNPLVAALLAFAFLKERLARIEVAALVIVVAGACFIVA